MMRWVLTGFFSCLFFLAAATENISYLEVPAQQGDGVYALLRRFELSNYSCNHELFYKLNKLKRDDGLQVGKYYQLPIQQRTFNGKSIRSSIGINDYAQAVEIQEFNERMVRSDFKPKSFQADRILWVPYHLLSCPEPDLIDSTPPANQDGERREDMTVAGNRMYPIFGKDYAHVPLVSDRLAGQIFYVVGGHGGPDPGAIGKYRGHTLCEDEYAYDVSLRLARYLIANGATTYVIARDDDDGIRPGSFLDCDKDEQYWGGIDMDLSQRKRLTQRSDVINNLYAKHQAQGVSRQTAIMIHVDSRSRGAQTDLFFYHHPASKDGARVARKVHETFVAKYKKYRSSGKYNGSVTARDLHMLRECKAVGLYVEIGNIRNSFDQKRFVLESNREALAKWIYEGLAK